MGNKRDSDDSNDTAVLNILMGTIMESHADVNENDEHDDCKGKERAKDEEDDNMMKMKATKI